MTSHHDAVMAYYFMDENNQVKITEIFDVTKAESEAIFHDHHGGGGESLKNPNSNNWESNFVTLHETGD